MLKKSSFLEHILFSFNSKNLKKDSNEKISLSTDH